MPKSPSSSTRSGLSRKELDEHTKLLMSAIERMVEAKPFQAYSPFVTYSTSSGGRKFLNGNGVPVHRNAENPDAEALWRIGQQAYLLLKVQSAEDLATRYRRFKRAVAELISLLSEAQREGVLVDEQDAPISKELLALEQRSEAEILSLAAQLVIQDETWGELLAFACLREVDNALIGMELDGRGAASSGIQAAHTLADAQACINGSPAFRTVRQKMAYEGALARHRNDPRQREKAFVFECYKAWRANREKYKSRAAFARDMLDKCEYLTSQKKIEDWTRDWDVDLENGTLPAE